VNIARLYCFKAGFTHTEKAKYHWDRDYRNDKDNLFGGLYIQPYQILSNLNELSPEHLHRKFKEFNRFLKYGYFKVNTFGVLFIDV
jgi:hypothetical protein